MALRLIEVFLPEESKDRVQEALEDPPVLGIWQESLGEGQGLVKILLQAEEAEAVLDLLEKRFSMLEDFRIILLPVEASIPRPEPEEEPPEEEQAQPEQEPEAKATRISRAELYADITDVARLSKVYVALVVLSSIVAAVGLIRSNVAVIIGAMVIAPLLGPSVALSLATTLGDTDLTRQALKVNAVGLLTAGAVSVLIGVAFQVSPDIPEIAIRTKVGLSDVVLALASASAGVLSFTMGVATAVVGVMIAVALLPPLVALGMLLGAGHWDAALVVMILLSQRS